MDFPQVNLEEIKAKYPKAIVLTQELIEMQPPATFAFKRPTKQYVDMLSAGAAKKFGRSMRDMVLGCLIAPEREEVEAIFEEYPGAVLSLGNKLLDIVGLKDPEQIRP